MDGLSVFGILGFIFGVMGMMAYLEVSKLKNRLAQMERELTRMQGTSFHADRSALVAAAKSYVGRQVNLELEEDHEDVDVVMYGNTKHGANTILDVDDDWLLVRVDTPKGSKEKLIRMESVERIAVLAEE